jgi:hypothetical protein
VRDDGEEGLEVVGCDDGDRGWCHMMVMGDGDTRG